MSTTNGGAAQATDGGAQANAAQPQLNVLAQYVKDLSFENPNAPRSLQQQQQAPQINIQINVNAKPMSGSEYEVELKIEGRAEVREHTAVRLRPALCRRIPHPERAAGQPARRDHDRVPAPVVPVRTRADRDRGAQWRVPAADDRSGGFRRALPPEAGRAAAPAGSAARLALLTRRLRPARPRAPWSPHRRAQAAVPGRHPAAPPP